MTIKPKSKTAIVTIKGFDRDLKCLNFQYEIGKTYECDGPIVACQSGFHAIEGHPLEVFGYYRPGVSRYAEVRQSGNLARHSSDSKVASAKITIGVELHLHEIVQRAVRWVIDNAAPEECSHSTGTQGAASSTGDQGAASSTGDQGAASSTGDQGAASSTGYQGMASSTGYRGAASSTGYQGAASSTGYRGVASSTGTRGVAISTGYQGAASSTGYRGMASSTGYQGIVMGTSGNALFLVYRNPDNGEIMHAWAGIVGCGGVEPGIWYCLGSDGKPEIVA